jgi:hypothetical protein
MLTLFSLLLGAPLAQASVVHCQQTTTAAGLPECKVKFVMARPMSVLTCVGGAGNFVVFAEGDADDILSLAAPIISGEVTGTNWLEVAEKVIAQTRKSLAQAKIRHHLQIQVSEYQATPPAEGAAAPSAPKRQLFRVTGTLIQPPPPKERITFFDKKEDQ